MKNWHTRVYSQENQISSYHHHFRHEPSMPVSISITSYPPLMQLAINNQHLVISAEININPPVENQHSFGGTIKTNYSPTDTIDQDIKDQQVYKEQVLNHNQNSTSKRRISRSSIDHFPCNRRTSKKILKSS